jgi:hypothetical protein
MSLLRSGRNRRRMRRLRARRGCRWVVLKWHAHESLAHWRVLRSQVGFAGTADEAAKPGSAQLLVYEGSESEVQDRDVIEDIRYYYTVFGREPGGEWLGQADVRVTPRCEISYTRENPAERERLSLSGIGPHLT